MKNNLHNVRKDYQKATLSMAEAPTHPDMLIQQWMGEAEENDPNDFNAFVLSTANLNGEPSARVVLARAISPIGLTFYTNYQSRKGKELIANPRAAATFFWKDLERQLRISGAVHKLNPQESDAYFASRPRASQIGAWASQQSQTLKGGADELTSAVEEMNARFHSKDNIPRPNHWGGFQISLDQVEFWQGRPNRLHQRLQYTREPNGATYEIEWLNP